MSDSRRLLTALLVGGLTGLAVGGMIYLVHALANHRGSESAATLIQECRDRISSLQELLEARG